MKLWWTSLRADGSAMWKIARSAANRIFSSCAGILRWANTSHPLSWKAEDAVLCPWIFRMVGSVRNELAELGSIASVTYNRLFLKRDPIFSSRGVPILRVVSGSLRSRFKGNQSALPLCSWMCRVLALGLICGSSLMVWAQQAPAASGAGQANVVEQIRVIGNRRIPRETVLARLFTHPGDVYDPATIERDFNSLWEHRLL